ncbi:MAG: hypothetical protein ACRD32_06755, partial [Nitrososphaerales archaeon]
PLPGYTAGVFGTDCDAGGSVTVALGETKTCTITNDDIPAHLIVIKHVINDNTGSAAASGFTMIIGGVTAIGGNSFSGAESPGTDKTLSTVGSYSVTETGPSGYTSSSSADCTGTIALGQTKTCTITNNDIQATRTQGFWSNQVKIVRQVLGMSPSGTNLNIPGSSTITLGGSTSGKKIDDLSTYFASFTSSISKNSDGTARSTLNQAKMQLTQQAVAAIMNCKMGSSPGIDAGAVPPKPFLSPSCNAIPGTSVGDAINVSANTAANRGEILRVKTALDTFNNSGDPIPLTPVLTSLLGANPALKSTIAATIFNDSPSAGTETAAPATPNGLSGVGGYNDLYWTGFVQPFDI